MKEVENHILTNNEQQMIDSAFILDTEIVHNLLIVEI